MTIEYPHTIENPLGEKLTFLGIEPGPEGDKVLAESWCQPGCGPAMHTHLQQDECLTVVSGSMGYQIQGEAPKFAQAGDTVLFKRGEAHRFWAEGKEVLHCKGWIHPANTIVFFLGSIFRAQQKSGKGEPEMFDGAYLLTRYAREYDMPEIPGFVKKVILPVTYFVGNVLGKYGHFKDAPAPL